MTALRSLLDALAAHVADENDKAARALADTDTAPDANARGALIADYHDHLTRADVWRQAYGLVAPHAHLPAPRAPGDQHVPGRVRIGPPGDGEPGEGQEP